MKQNQALTNTRTAADSIEHEILAAATRIERQLTDLRTAILEIDDEIRWLESAHLDFEDASARICDYVDSRAGQLPSVREFFDDKNTAPRPFVLKSHSFAEAPAHVVSGLVARIVVEGDLGGLMCSLFGDTVKDVLVAQAHKELQLFDCGPPLAERPALILAAKARKRQLEIDEEALIDAAAIQGLSGPALARRPDINAEIVFMKPRGIDASV